MTETTELTVVDVEPVQVPALLQPEQLTVVNRNNAPQEKPQPDRSVQELQLLIIAARNNPRNEMKAYQSIIETCRRLTFAKKALYPVMRGGKTVGHGASIRMAEMLALKWGNVYFGSKVTERCTERTKGEAMAIDLETVSTKFDPFEAEHGRYSKEKGFTYTPDPNEWSQIANASKSKAIRNCILTIIPPDIIEAAIEECNNTIKNADAGVPLIDRVRRCAVEFKSRHQVTQEDLEAYLGHALDQTNAGELDALGAIFMALESGEQHRSEFFGPREVKVPEPSSKKK